MRGGAIAIVVLVAACGGSGVDLEVHTAGVQIDTVELFIAPSPCVRNNGSPCSSGIAWASAMQEQPPGGIFLLDSDAQLTEKVTGDIVRFRIEAVLGKNHVARVAAIGLAQGKPVAAGKLAPDLDIPLDHPEVWRLDLEPVEVASGETPDAPPNGGADKRAMVWSSPMRMSGLADCAMLQHWNGTSWDRDYYVPATDRDCDGESPECNPYFFDFNTTGVAKVCMTTNGPSEMGACTLGSSLCADGKNGNNDCTQLPSGVTCFGSDLCASCNNDPSLDVNCLGMLISNQLDAGQASTIPFADCQFVPDSAANNGPCQIIPTANQATLDLTGNGFGMCTAARLLPLAFPVQGPTTSVMVGNATVILAHVANGSANCQITFQWQSGTGDPAVSQAFLLSVDFASGSTVDMPVRFGFTMPGDCVTSVIPPNCVMNGPVDDLSVACSLM